MRYWTTTAAPSPVCSLVLATAEDIRTEGPRLAEALRGFAV